ncbi:ATP-binding cassette domain-containing protein [Robiginitalea sp.]|uniref:ABC transporter ATP-binding protein n=1 Tax=Robiginitalea sp. TaxID=1902411 RepID=UPI003C74D82A
MRAHTAIYTDNTSDKEAFARKLLHGEAPPALSFLNGEKGAYFSNSSLSGFLEAEARYDYSDINLDGRTLKTLSSGERKKALLKHLLEKQPDFLILDNLFDNLDPSSREALKGILEARAGDLLLVQLLSRSQDLLECIQNKAFLSGDRIMGFPNYTPETAKTHSARFTGALPPAPDPPPSLPEVLIDFRKVDLSYGPTPILTQIEWAIKKGDFWELKGPNGSGKTSLITMIIGDNPKAYGQELYLFGNRKGSGESVWDIKAKIGYFTPALTDRFRGNHTAEAMLISGLLDSVGLYIAPTDRQRALARSWLALLGLSDRARTQFRNLSEGHQRLLMCARAMIKHPPVLILDEPTAGLDAASASLLISLVQKMAAESDTAILFVSHRKEPGLQAPNILELLPGKTGSRGVIHTSKGQ